MRPIYLKDILAVIDGEILNKNENPLITHITERLSFTKENTLYFHINKNYPIAQTGYKSHHLVIVTDSPDVFKSIEPYVILVKVPNILEAYWKFIHYYRSLFQIPIIGITGTSGKTTTKEMIKWILEEDLNVVATDSSNNALSLNIKYLTAIDDHTDVAVLEMGVDGPGNLKKSCMFFKPQIRVLLNIGVHHLKRCRTPEQYLKAKAELIDNFDPKTDTLILNKDDENIKKIDINPIKHNIISFGFNRNADFRASNYVYQNQGMGFTLQYKKQILNIYVPGYGKHNVYNALAALAVTTTFGIPLQKSIQRLGTFQPLIEHLEFKKGTGGSTIIDDTWNSSSLSISAALDVLQNISPFKQKIVILSYLPQLGNGDFAEEQYVEIGKLIVSSGATLLIVVNKEAEIIGKTALNLGMNPNQVFFVEDGLQVYHILKKYLLPETLILLKVTHRVMIEPSFVQLKNYILP